VHILIDITRSTASSISSTSIRAFIPFPFGFVSAADRGLSFYLFILKIHLMAVLVQRWHVGGIWVTCWFVSPGQYVFASQLGYSFSTSCEPPWGWDFGY
jgi:hypothetical protein